MSRWMGSSKFLIILGLMCLFSVGVQLSAQQTSSPPPSSPPSEQQPPAHPPDQSGQQAPSAQAQPQDTQAQTFTGTVVKSGDRYMLQDADAGVTYDIDRQDLAQPHQGKKVRIQGVLDPNGKLIHVK
jgi:uncharacterized protein YdeI (BOF family)